ncbi:MAG TPA: ABC transporter permease, partial [Actinoplanes sp.]|nr:ABC transporter permease [Actinoplanes sp.]
MLRRGVRPPAAGGRTVSVVAWPVAGLAAAIGLWWAAARAFAIESIILPAPPEVVAAFAALPGHLLRQAWQTTLATLLGFGLSAVVGIAIGVAIAAWRPVERMCSPLLVAFNAVPKVALAPLML